MQRHFGGKLAGPSHPLQPSLFFCESFPIKLAAVRDYDLALRAEIVRRTCFAEGPDNLCTTSARTTSARTTSARTDATVSLFDLPVHSVRILLTNLTRPPHIIFLIESVRSFTPCSTSLARTRRATATRSRLRRRAG